MKDFYRLSEHIYIERYGEENDCPNVAVITDGKSSLFFDLGVGPSSWKKLVKDINENNLPFPDAAVISHYHWDHTFASGLFEGKLYGSLFTKERMNLIMNTKLKSIDDLIDGNLFMPEFCRAHLHMEYNDVSEIKLRGIDEVISNQTIRVGELEIQILEVVSPHSEGQLVLYVPEDKVLLLGDSPSGEVVGTEFVDIPEKRQIYDQMIGALDFKICLHSHLDPLSREELFAQFGE